MVTIAAVPARIRVRVWLARPRAKLNFMSPPVWMAIEERERAREAEGMGFLVPRAWIDDVRDHLGPDLLDRAQASRCCAADRCVLDERCPFVVGCRRADAEG